MFYEYAFGRRHGCAHQRSHQFAHGLEEGRRYGRFAGRGGFLGWFADGWMGGPGIRAARVLASGDLRLIILALLNEKPRHGYEIIKALEDHSSGMYVPSPGMVYPALTYLEEMGHAEVEADGTRSSIGLPRRARSIWQRIAVPLTRRSKGWRDSGDGSPISGAGSLKRTRKRRTSPKIDMIMAVATIATSGAANGAEPGWNSIRYVTICGRR